jgi:hypothetical protein
MADTKQQIDELIETLKRQRDQLALKIHLGKADAKDEWKRLEKKLAELMAQARPVGGAVGDTAKNVGSALMGYKRHKSYPWADTFWAGLYMLDHLPPHRTGHRGFDWRWLAQGIRHFMRIREIRKNPFQWVPNMFAFSVMMIAEPRE